MRHKASTLLSAMLLSATASSSAWPYEALWSTTGENEEIVAIDCRDCEEELGIIIACKGNGKPAEVTVNAAASQTGEDGAEAPFTIVIDGDPFTRNARTVEYGMIGSHACVQHGTGRSDFGGAAGRPTPRIRRV